MNRRLKYIVEFEIDEKWIADGFDLTQERAKSMLANELSHANGSELEATIVLAPEPHAIAVLQGTIKAHTNKHWYFFPDMDCRYKLIDNTLYASDSEDDDEGYEVEWDIVDGTYTARLEEIMILLEERP